ncbi:MAG: hypothetical protein ACHREM_04615 [Polyangiales bacterium]
MHNLSMKQTLGIWSELDDAYYGKHSYGGDTVELYAYRLMPNDPSDSHEPYVAAAQSLRALIALWEELHDDARVLVEGERGSVTVLSWLEKNTFRHRIHMQVERPKKDDKPCLYCTTRVPGAVEVCARCADERGP